MSLPIVYVSIGNSDDKLSQREWSMFVRDFLDTMRTHSGRVHGEWFSASGSPFQNACVAAEVPPDASIPLRWDLTQVRKRYGQDSIAWAEVPSTEFL